MDASTPEPASERVDTDGSGSGTGRRRPTRRTIVVTVVALLVVVAVVIAAVVLGDRGRGAGDADPAADTPATIAPTTSGEPVDGDAPSADPTAEADPAAPVEAPPVGLEDTAEPIPDVRVSLAGLAAVEGVADGPGEIAGPALSFTVTVVNGTDQTVSLATSVVTVTSGDDLLPADQLATGGVPLPSEVAAGQTATGTFVFTVPVERRDDVRITFDYLAGTPAVVFQGAAPRP